MWYKILAIPSYQVLRLKTCTTIIHNLNESTLYSRNKFSDGLYLRVCEMYMLSRIQFLPMNYLEVFLAFKLGIFLLVLC